MAWNRFFTAINLASLAFTTQASSARGVSQQPSLAGQCRSSPAGPLLQNEADTSCSLAVDDKTPVRPGVQGPWATRPTCINSTDDGKPKLCVYLYRNFRGSSGDVSLVATPETAAATAHIFEDHDGAWLRHAMGYEPKASDPPPCVVTKVAGKGRGVVARRAIRAGEIVMVEHPVFLRPLEFGRWPAKGRELLRLLSVGGNQLPIADRWKIMNMARHGDGDMLDDVFNTNSFAVALSEMEYSGLFPDVAVCDPLIRT